MTEKKKPKDEKPEGEKPEKKSREEREEETRKALMALAGPVRVGRGRPSDYKPEFCFTVTAAGAEGKSKTVIASELGISLRTLYNWMMQYPDFLHAMEQAETDAQAWWEEVGRKAMFMQGFNSSVWSRSMSARFPRDWRENKNVEVTSKGPGGIEINASAKTLKIENMSERALGALEEALQIALVETQDEDDQSDD
jgi:transposase